MLTQWQLGMVVTAFLFNLLLAYQAYRLRQQDDRTGGGSGETDLVDEEAGIVECPDCGTENDVGYRFCRECVTELPLAMGFTRARDTPFGRLMR